MDEFREVDPALADELQLALIPGVGPRLRKSLLEWFETPAAVLDAPPSLLRRVPGVGRKLCERIVHARREIDPQQIVELCRRHDIGMVTEACSHYPEPLRTIHDPPAVLFSQGSWEPGDALAVGIVGTRHATAYGIRQAERLSRGLARAGLTVVSGMARGIDAAAHRAALEAERRTIAVLGSGLLNVYPPEHGQLARQIREQGVLLSEAPPHARPLAGAFPQRNRLIAGLSLGVIVVEAADRSGALITAEHALEQGREVFAVPGPVDSRMSRGCHRLLREGARLVEHMDDVLEELGPLANVAPDEGCDEIRHPAELQLNDIERRILHAVPQEPTTIDAVVASVRLPVQRVLATISVLEMRRLIRRISGNLVSRV